MHDVRITIEAIDINERITCFCLKKSRQKFGTDDATIADETQPFGLCEAQCQIVIHGGTDDGRRKHSIKN
jgi:hypothetical protein